MPSRAKIAALVTVVALGAFAAVALASDNGRDARAVQTRDDQSQGRNEPVRQIVHRRALRHHAAATRHDDRGHEIEPGDDPGHEIEPGDDRAREIEPGDDRGHEIEPGDDHGGGSGRGGGNSGPGGGDRGHGGGDD